MTAAHEYAKSYSSYSGADIVASINRKVFAELQGITYSISRAKAPIYTMGSAEPRSFSRGNRGIAGTLVFSVFDRDALMDAFQKDFEEKNIKVQKYAANDPERLKAFYPDNTTGFTSVDDWDRMMTSLVNDSVESGTITGDRGPIVGKFTPHYADEILPFDVTLTFANEYGNASRMVIYGIEIMNEGSGFSTDTMVTEKAYTYMARRIESMKEVGEGERFTFASSW